MGYIDGQMQKLDHQPRASVHLWRAGSRPLRPLPSHYGDTVTEERLSPWNQQELSARRLSGVRYGPFERVNNLGAAPLEPEFVDGLCQQLLLGAQQGVRFDPADEIH